MTTLLPDLTGIECWEDELSVTGPIHIQPVKQRADSLPTQR